MTSATGATGATGSAGVTRAAGVTQTTGAAGVTRAHGAAGVTRVVGATLGLSVRRGLDASLTTVTATAAVGTLWCNRAAKSRACKLKRDTSEEREDMSEGGGVHC